MESACDGLLGGHSDHPPYPVVMTETVGTGTLSGNPGSVARGLGCATDCGTQRWEAPVTRNRRRPPRAAVSRDYGDRR